MRANKSSLVSEMDFSMPLPRPKRLPLRNSLPIRRHVIIQRVENAHIAPPCRRLNTRQSDCKEDGHRAQDQTSVQRSSSQVIILPPPTVPSLPDPQIEDKPENDPREEAQRRGRRQPCHGTKHDGCVEVADVTVLHEFRQAPEGDWQNTAEQPEVVEVFVDTLTPESARGTDDTPDHA